MDKGLDISTIERQNVLNNSFAVKAIQNGLLEKVYQRILIKHKK